MLGFLELQAGQAHNRFLNELEEWLSGVTRLSSAGPVGDGEQSVPAFIQALLEKTADSLDQLQHVISRGEGERNAVNQNLVALTERLSTLTDQMRAEQSVLMRLAESQSDMKGLITRLGEWSPESGTMDETTRTHIRNLDLRLEHLLNDMAGGREYAVQEGSEVVAICAALEADIAQLDDEDKAEFLEAHGLDEPGLNHVIRCGYKLLDLQTFFTASPKEARAWTTRIGSSAPKAAAEIHTDFERGFIRAEVISYEDYVAGNGEQGAKELGRLRLEGKDYIVQEGDVMHFRFNV